MISLKLQHNRQNRMVYGAPPKGMWKVRQYRCWMGVGERIAIGILLEIDSKQNVDKGDTAQALPPRDLMVIQRFFAEIVVALPSR